MYFQSTSGLALCGRFSYFFARSFTNLTAPFRGALTTLGQTLNLCYWSRWWKSLVIRPINFLNSCLLKALRWVFSFSQVLTPLAVPLSLIEPLHPHVRGIHVLNPWGPDNGSPVSSEQGYHCPALNCIGSACIPRPCLRCQVRFKRLNRSVSENIMYKDLCTHQWTVPQPDR